MSPCKMLILFTLLQNVSMPESLSVEDSVVIHCQSCYRSGAGVNIALPFWVLRTR